VRYHQVVAPKRPRNLGLTLAAAAFSVGLYLVFSWGGLWSPKRGLGLAFGILAALLFTFEMAYPARRGRARPLGTAERWLQAHVYLGALACVGVLVHCGFEWPKGALGWALWLLSLWTTLTGLLGVFLQKWIPAALCEGLRVEALFERIPALVEGLRDEADKLLEDSGEALLGFYQRDVRPALEGVQPSWGFIFDLRAGQERALDPFRRMGPFVDPDDKPRLDDLMVIVGEKRELDAHYSLQRLLRGWLWLHAPMAGLLMGLLLVHVFSWLWY